MIIGSQAQAVIYLTVRVSDVLVAWQLEIVGVILCRLNKKMAERGETYQVRGIKNEIQQI